MGLENLKYLIEALRGGSNPQAAKDSLLSERSFYNPKGGIPSSARLPHGYLSHVIESKAMGEEPMSYEEWVKQNAT